MPGVVWYAVLIPEEAVDSPVDYQFHWWDIRLISDRFLSDFSGWSPSLCGGLHFRARLGLEKCRCQAWNWRRQTRVRQWKWSFVPRQVFLPRHDHLILGSTPLSPMRCRLPLGLQQRGGEASPTALGLAQYNFKQASLWIDTCPECSIL